MDTNCKWIVANWFKFEIVNSILVFTIDKILLFLFALSALSECVVHANKTMCTVITFSQQYKYSLEVPSQHLLVQNQQWKH